MGKAWEANLALIIDGRGQVDVEFGPEARRGGPAKKNGRHCCAYRGGSEGKARGEGRGSLRHVGGLRSELRGQPLRLGPVRGQGALERHRLINGALKQELE